MILVLEIVIQIAPPPYVPVQCLILIASVSMDPANKYLGAAQLTVVLVLTLHHRDAPLVVLIYKLVQIGQQ